MYVLSLKFYLKKDIFLEKVINYKAAVYSTISLRKIQMSSQKIRECQFWAPGWMPSWSYRLYEWFCQIERTAHRKCRQIGELIGERKRIKAGDLKIYLGKLWNWFFFSNLVSNTFGIFFCGKNPVFNTYWKFNPKILILKTRWTAKIPKISRSKAL